MRARPRSARARTEDTNRLTPTQLECAGFARARFARSAVPKTRSKAKLSNGAKLKLVAGSQEAGGGDKERRNQ